MKSFKTFVEGYKPTGKPVGKPRKVIPDETLDTIYSMRAAGLGHKQIYDTTGIPHHVMKNHDKDPNNQARSNYVPHPQLSTSNNVNSVRPTEDDYKYLYNARKSKRSDKSIHLGDKDHEPFGYSPGSIRRHFDSDEAKQRSDYHPPAADNRSGLTDSQYNQVYRLRSSGHPETHIHKTMGIHKDTIAKYIDSDEAKTRPNYHPPIRKRK